MIEKKILWATIEDYVGLWEINWEFNDGKIKHSEIVQILMQFLKKKYVELYFCKEPYGELKKVQGNSEALIIDAKNWQEPLKGGDISVRVSATKLGERYYNSLR